MLALTLLAALTVPTPADPADPQAPQPRAAVAQGLESVLAAARADGPADLSTLIETAEDAADRLGPGPLAERLADAVRQVRLMPSDDPAPARELLLDALDESLADLTFEPVLEANLPEGFPAPTPVGAYEVKQYPAYRVARADTSGNGAFWQLFMHIKKHDIPMTAPVEMTYDDQGAEVDMAFMYEHVRQGTTGPDEQVEVLDVAPMLVVSVGCRGWSSSTRVDQARAELLAWIDAQPELVVDGPARRFGYNGPSVRGERRFFEVQVPVRRLRAE